MDARPAAISSPTLSHRPRERVRVPVACATKSAWTIHVPRNTGLSRGPVGTA